MRFFTSAARAPVWLRGFVAFLAVPQLLVGAWAIIWPRGFYDHFPGFGPMLVASLPPYNAHLTSDAGGGFLATGVVLALAAVIGAVGPIRLALVGYLAFALPHAVFHASNQAPGLTATEDVVNVAVLAAAAALPVVLLTLTRDERTTDGHPATDLALPARDGQRQAQSR